VALGGAVTGARQQLAAAVSEADWLAQVRAAAQLTGWRTYHTWRSDRSEGGFPDLVLCRPPRVILAELKREKGRLSALQEAWLEDLRACVGVETYVWRPSELGEVLAILRREVAWPRTEEGDGVHPPDDQP
jgi:hypothetical protein